MLAGLVTLRRSTGARVALDADAGLRACGHAAVLAQVVTNLLANCERHAPEAPVTVRGYRAGERVVVEVRDEGPGLRAALGHDVLQRGVHDPAAGGSGLGLHISAQLLAREGGELDLRTVTDPRGCLATVSLPASDAPGAIPARIGRRRIARGPAARGRHRLGNRATNVTAGFTTAPTSGSVQRGEWSRAPLDAR